MSTINIQETIPEGRRIWEDSEEIPTGTYEIIEEENGKFGKITLKKDDKTYKIHKQRLDLFLTTFIKEA